MATTCAVIRGVSLSHALLETVMGRSGLAEEEATRKKDEQDRGLVRENASTAATTHVGHEAMEEGSTHSESNGKFMD